MRDFIQPETLEGHGLPMAILSSFLIGFGWEDSPGGHKSRYGLCQKLWTGLVRVRAEAGGEW